MKRAVELNAYAIVIAHIHLSGDPTPSQGDIAITEELREAREKLAITLHDRIVVGQNGTSSFKSLGLL